VDVDVEQLASVLHVSIGLLVRQLRQQSKLDAEGGLTLPQTSALARLDRLGPMTAAQLARHEQISPQSMGATLASLELRGLVDRIADARDGRRMILSLTASGVEVLRSRRTARAQLLAHALEDQFTATELRQLAAAAPLLERLAQSL
jgi:DNA-binding MarR family transcriptional regulator